MQKIGDIPNSNSTDHNEFADGDFPHGKSPTHLRADWLNAVQREIIAIIEKFGIVLNPPEALPNCIRR